jgi:hypothetical protein
MRRLRLPMLIAAFMLVPQLAHAGWIDWLNRLSGPGPFTGIGEDFDLYCFDANGNRFPLCQGVVLFRPDTARNINSVEDLRHVLSARTEFFWSTGDERFQDVAAGPFHDAGVRAWRITGLYQYRFGPDVQAGFGLGFMKFSGDGFDSFYRPTFTPVSVTIGLFGRFNPKLKPVQLIFDETYITQGFTGLDFGNNVTSFNTHGGEWKSSLKIAYDFRRR